jgi:ubiquinone/menaquinone biosynthesis C-methylase UbiE
MRNTQDESPFDRPFGNRVERLRFVLDSDIKNKVILDIGCGFGWCDYDFLQRGVKEIVGLDLTNDSKKALMKLDSKKFSFVQGSALNLPFDDNYFDTVVTWEVIEHIPRGKELVMLKEVKRVLKPGGKLYLSTQHNNPISTILDPAWWLIGHRHYSKSKIRNMIEASGLVVDTIFTKGGLYTVIWGLNGYFTKWVLRRKPLFIKFFHRKTTQEYERDTGFTNVFMKATNENDPTHNQS